MSYQCLCCETNDAGHRYACAPCVDKMRRWLREVETYAAMLPHMLHPMREDTARRAPGFGSQPPARIEALVALDPRSRPSGSVDRVFDPEIDDEDPTRSILDALYSMARMVREEQEVPEPSKPPTITREIGYLLGVVDGVPSASG